MNLYIGLISGTSMDGVDAALVDIGEETLNVIASLTFPYPERLRNKLMQAICPDYVASLHEIATLNIEVGEAFAAATTELLRNASADDTLVHAIGSHGQTLRHSPDSSPPYTVQIGDGATIAALTKINTVCDFRGLDIANGGQGAPLVPAFHEWLFRTKEQTRVVLNIGGIANITVLPKDSNEPLIGFDTGPGNCLMDEWCHENLGTSYDENGDWAKTGRLSELLLEQLAADAYFAQPIPKSTGREYFNLDWLRANLNRIANLNLSNADIQTTLLALTTSTIAEQINQCCSDAEQILICGGGVFNDTLVATLKNALGEKRVNSTSDYGVDPAMIEAIAFAWLAQCRLQETPVRLTTNGRSSTLVLGAMYIAPRQQRF